MNVDGIIAQIKSQLEKISIREQANQKEQAEVNLRIEQLEAEIPKQHRRRSELDEEALQLYKQAEELKAKLNKLEKISLLSREFQELQAEFQDNQDLLHTLYSSVAQIATLETPANGKSKQKQNKSTPQKTSDNNRAADASGYQLSIQEIKAALPNAEKIYQHLVAGYLEEYKTYQNFIVDGLDLIWYSVAFIAFGRACYRQMSFKYHPDLTEGSERAMQLINTAWSISQNYLGDTKKDNISGISE